MKEFVIILAVCLNFGVISSQSLHQSCQTVQDGICSKGQYLLHKDRARPVCVDCPENTFMDIDSHACETCKSHTQPGSGEVIVKRGDATCDNTILCRESFYRSPSSGKCQRCTLCKHGSWAARECSSESDTLCCLDGTIAVQKGDHVKCASWRLGQKKAVRKGRSSSSSNGNNSIENDSDLDPDIHSTFTEKPRKPMVEFPVWGKILCAAIAAGIFLFYLGVGIPCNACGSLEKLHKITNFIFRRNRRRPAEEESKQPMNTSSDPTQA